MLLHAFHPNNIQNPLLKTLLKKEVSHLIEIGDFTYGVAPIIRYWGGDYTLSIGKFCSIADGITFFMGGNHDVKAITTSPLELFFKENTVRKEFFQSKEIKIGNDVWIGSGATIMSGSIIGDGAVIGARAVVAGKIPPYSIAVGNPARVVKYRFSKDIIDLLLGLKWWDWAEEKIKENATNLISPDYHWLTQMKIDANQSLISVNVEIPSIINIVRGKNWRSDALNIGINPTLNPDILIDMAKPFVNGEKFDVFSDRFGQITLRKNSFERIIAHDVLGSVPDLVTFMKNGLDLLREGGIFDISVPYDLSLKAWEDPMCIRAFNENSWIYYTGLYWQLGWNEAHFVTEKLEFKLSAYGIELKSNKKSTQEILRAPRAVDEMNILLKKVQLGEKDRNC